MEVDFVGTQQADRAQQLPEVERIGPRTVRAQGANYLEMFRLFILMMR
jgi:D-aminopeptidase